MTTHARALDLAAAMPAFTLDVTETRELREHLRSCPDCARRAVRLRADAAALGSIDPAVSPRLHDRLREAAVSAPRSGPSPIGIVLAFVLLAAGVVGASLGAGALVAPRLTAPNLAGPVVEEAPGDAVRWQTDIVAFAATALEIEANGLVFTGGAAARVVSDPGNLERWTLEATWQEHGAEQRLTMTFGSDQRSWWIDEIRTYDGTGAGGDPKWATFPPGPYAQTPIGRPFGGDLDLAGTSATGPVRLHLAGMRIAVQPGDPVNDPVGGPRIVLVENGNPAVDGDPFAVGGPLRCSGILQLPPIAAEARLLSLGYSLSWRWETATSANTGFSEVRKEAPAAGWITNTGIGMDGELIVFVANPDAPFGGPPRDLAPECATTP